MTWAEGVVGTSFYKNYLSRFLRSSLSTQPFLVTLRNASPHKISALKPWSRILIVCNSCKTSSNVLSHSHWERGQLVGGGGLLKFGGVRVVKKREPPGPPPGSCPDLSDMPQTHGFLTAYASVNYSCVHAPPPHPFRAKSGALAFFCQGRQTPGRGGRTLEPPNAPLWGRKKRQSRSRVVPLKLLFCALCRFS